jgi:hypothetical protein
VTGICMYIGIIISKTALEISGIIL